MSKKNIQQPVKGITFTAIGMAIGLVFGGLVGILIGNPAIFAGGTMVLEPEHVEEKDIERLLDIKI